MLLQIMSLDDTHSSSQSADVAFLQRKRYVVRSATKALKRALKNLQLREQTLQDCRNWNSVHHQGLLLQANLFRIKKGMSEIAIEDWEQDGKACVIPLDPRLDPKNQIVKIFQKGKKLRKGEPHAERLLQIAQNNLIFCEKQLADANHITSPTDLDVFCQTYNIIIPSEKTKPPAKEPKPIKPYHIFVTESGLEIWVGKSARNNDLLSFHYAKGSDWWLHARDYPGSHIVLRCTKNQDPDSDSLHDAAELALRFSKASQNQEGEVSVSQVKFITRIKGSPGKVQLSKHKVLHIRLNDARWSRLKSSKIT